MATSADQRLLDLLDKWKRSLELHAKYALLDDDTYWRVQDWPDHQRPSRWIIDLGLQKANLLKAQVEARVKEGDESFSDALELMTFLANLLGSQHIERFIPMADPGDERRAESDDDEAQEHEEDSRDGDTRKVRTRSTSATGTREMPKFIIEKPASRAPTSTAQITRTERRSQVKPPPKPAPPAKAPPARASAAKKPASPKLSPAEAAREQVIADAARLVQWGRKWYELAELIARMADRPSLIEVRRILKDNKTLIDKKAGRG